MMRVLPRSLFAASTLTALLLIGPATAAEPASAAPIGENKPVDFARDIRPLFARSCFHCHGPEEEEGGLRLDDRQRAMAGGVSGTVVIVPGKSADSLLWQFITGRNEDKVIMPPKDQGERLTDAECELVRRWIDAGAPWPAESAQDDPANSEPAMSKPAMSITEAALPANSSCAPITTCRPSRKRLSFWLPFCRTALRGRAG